MFQHYATHMVAPMKCLIDIQPTSNYISGRREREQATSLRILAKLWVHDSRVITQLTMYGSEELKMTPEFNLGLHTLVQTKEQTLIHIYAPLTYTHTKEDVKDE